MVNINKAAMLTSHETDTVIKQAYCVYCKPKAACAYALVVSSANEIRETPRLPGNLMEYSEL